jgi:hypothetical protein
MSHLPPRRLRRLAPLRHALACAVLAACSTLAARPALALGERPVVRFDAAPGAVTLARGGSAARLVVDAAEDPAVKHAAASLRDDIARVSGARPALLAAVPDGAAVPAAGRGDLVLVGTLGSSPVIDRLAREGRIDVSTLRGKWEGYLIQTVRNPLPGVAQALVIAGSDRRGTVYGMYTLSEQIGVSPWHWWADVPPAHHDVLAVEQGARVQDAPAVQYRGIFLNDEAPALSGFAKDTFGGFNHRFYEKVFELILRLRGNYLWPAMWGNAFYDDDPENGRLAQAMGVVIGTSHHEPLMRAHAEWAKYGKGPWDYGKNEKVLRAFWQQGLERSHDFEKVITIGMRGDGDEPMSEESNVALLQRIVADQRALIAADAAKPTLDPASRPGGAAAPQMWALYKEVQDYYEKGMRVPDDVLLLWCDDNWGNIRRLPTAEERKRAGGAGIYYHFDYVGGPRSYKWINVTPLPKVWEQMHLAATYGADRLWIVNVGDLKPLEVPIEFFLSYAWNPQAWPAERLPGFLKLWATREFGPVHADEIAALVEGYARFNGRRKPEQLEPGTFSSEHYREAERVGAEWQALADRARALAPQLAQAQRDAYFELVQYPVEAANTLNQLYLTVQRNRLHAAQGRADTNALAAQARALFAQDAALARRYEAAAGGKWKHMMAQTHIGYTSWKDPATNVMPQVAEIALPAQAALGVAAEGSAAAYPATPTLALPAFEPLATGPRFIEVFNRGQAPLGFKAHADQPWIRLDAARGTVAQAQRIAVDVDWARVPASATAAHVSVTGPDGAKAVVEVTLRHAGLRAQDAHGFVETGGVVAIEAEHYARALAPAGRAWLRVPGFGATLSGMTTLPSNAAPATLDDAMRLEYEVWLTEPGTLKVEATLAPTLKFRPGPGFRYAVSFDDAAPVVVDVHADGSNRHWEKIVSDGVARFTSEHAVTSAGRHTLKFWALDPALVLERLVIDGGGLQPSYLGPPESPRLP